MKIASPGMLYLIWLVPVVAGLYWHAARRRRRILGNYATDRALAAIGPAAGTSGPRRALKAALVTASLALFVVSLSGVKYGHTWRKVERRGVDIVVAIDLSRSMLAGDVSPSRLERAKREVKDLIAMAKGDRIALVAFSGTAFLQCPLTMDYGVFGLYLDNLTPDYLPVGGSNLAEAINVSVKAFKEKTDTDKAVIIITDGESTITGFNEAASGAASMGVKLFFVGVGTPDGAPIPEAGGGFKKDAAGNIVLTRLDESTLKSLASATGGAYVRSVTGDSDLDVIYSGQIRGSMKAASLAEERTKIFIDRYRWFVGLALMLLIIEAALPDTAARMLGVLFLVMMLSSPAMAGGRGDVKDGIEAYDSKQYEQALDHFQKAQVKEPDDPRVLYNIGNASYRLGRFDEAVKHFGLASEKAEKDTALRERSLYNLGNANFRKGDLQSAAKSYEQALGLDKQDEDAKRNLQYVRKLMQQQKQQQQQSDKDNRQDKKDDPSQSAGNDKNPQDNQQANRDEQGQQQDQQYASKADKGDRKDGQMDRQDIPQQDRSQGEDSQGGKSDASAMRPPPSVLNRLKDQPGKAMMPRYGRQEVREDW